MTVYSNVRTDLTQDDPTEMVKANQLGGVLRVAHASFEASSQAADTIEMFSLPNGARIVRALLCHDALGASTTLAVGHAAYTNSAGTAVAADPDEYKAAAASTSAQCVDAAYTLALGANSEVDLDGDLADNEFVVTVTTTGTTTGTIELTMYYVVD
jgi:type IV secretory pathway VirB4 component